MRFSLGTHIWHSAPFSIKIKKATWSAATDGSIMVAVRMPGASPIREDCKSLDDLKSMFSEPAVNPIEINLEELKAWAGDAPERLVSLGTVPPENQGVLLGYLIDRRKLAYLFAKITVPIVHAWIFVPEPLILGFEPPKGHWRAFIAGLADKPDGSEPVFQTKPKQDALSPLDLAELVDSSILSK